MSLRTHYLNALTKAATTDLPTADSSVSYPAADMKSEVTFDIIFTEYTELSGYAKLCLWMQCHEHDDMDIFVILCKIDEDGKVLRHVNYQPDKVRREDLPLNNVVQYQGPTGVIRASHRKCLASHASYSAPIPQDFDNTADDPPPV